MSGDPHRRLVRLLHARAGEGAALVHAAATPWASITYAGMRHRLAFALPSDRSDRLSGLEDVDLVIPGHLLVEIREVTRRAQGATTLVELAALTVEGG